MQQGIFATRDYKQYLSSWLEAQPGGGHGLRLKMAEHLGCKTSFISQVIRGHVHLSLEAAERLNSFLGHGKDEGLYFVLLVQWARAGSPGLRHLLETQMQAVQARQKSVKNRVDATKDISLEDQAVYLSSWTFAAVHAFLATPPHQTKTSISQALRIPPAQVTRVLEFLVSRGLAKQKGAHFTVGSFHVHFGHDQAFVTRHHLNWRLKAMQDLERGSEKDLHYSSVVNISRKDAEKLKAHLVDSIARARKIVDPSPEECLYALNVDMFQVSDSAE